MNLREAEVKDVN